MFVNTLEKKEKVYEIKDYDLSLLQNTENTGKVISIGAEGLEVMDMPVVEKVTGVAKVNGVYYNTLAEAVEAIELEGTITIMADIEPTEAIVFPADKFITLNLNGKTIKQEKAQTAAYSMIVVNGHLTIDSANGGLISYADTTEYTAAINYVSNVIVNNGTLIIKNGTIKNVSNRSVAEQGFPHAIDNNGKLIIEGGYISNADYSAMRIWCTEDANTEVIIKGGTFVNCIDMHNVNQKPNKGTLTIEGGTFKVSENGSSNAVRILGFGTDLDEIIVEIKGGTFEAPISVRNYVGGEMNSQGIYVSGGKFVADPSEFLAPGYEAVNIKNTYVIRKKVEVENAVAEVNGVKYATLIDAFNAVESVGEVKLINDIKLNEFTTLPIDVEITLNLNNHSIFASETVQINGCLLAVPNGSTLIINGCGNIYASAPDGSNKVYGAIQVVSKDTYDPSKTAKLIINNGNISGYYYGIVGNGSRGNSEVIINGGHLFATSPDGVAIYNPQPDSKVTINGGFIEGSTCIEIRAGDLTVNGGFLTSLTAPTEVNANGSGTTNTGSAIAIAQHNTKLPINVVINSGIVKGYHALHQANPQKNEEEAVALVNMSVNDGTFIAINGGNIPVYSENKEKFVTGGTFVPAIEEKYMA